MFPVWLWVVVLLAALGLAWWTYVGYKSIPASARTSLVVIRSLVFLLLLLLLLNPQFERTEETTRRPVVSFLVDNTASIDITKGSWNGAESMGQLFEQLSSIDTTSVKINVIGFSDGLDTDLYFDDFDFSKSGTNIHQSLTQAEQEIESDTFVLVSDGISTFGRDPVFAARQLTRPVHTIAVGDTSIQRDLVMQNVQYPASAFTNATVPIIATVRNEGYPGESLRVQLMDSNTLIDEQVIVTSENRSTHQVEFEIKSQNPGQKSFEMRVVPLPGEWTEENNQSNFSIEIKDDQIRILHIAYEMHPDVGAFRRVMANNPALLVEERTWISSDVFIEGAFPNRPDTLDLVVLHGISDRLPESILSETQRFIEDIPSIYFLMPSTSAALFEDILAPLSAIDVDLSREMSSIQLVASNDERGHPILDLPETEIARTPGLRSPVSGIRPKMRATDLIYASVRGQATSTPIVSVLQTGNNRSATFLAYGYYQWFLQPDESASIWMDQLLTNLINWTSADLAEERFDVRPSQQVFEIGQEVNLQATLRNEAGNPESDADIRVLVNNENQETRSFSMISAGNGLYSLDISGLPEGFYEFEANATVENQNLGNRSGSFQVGGRSVELINTTRNDEILQNISSNSSGVFATYENIGQILDEIQNTAVRASTVETRIPFYINRTILWFLLIMFLLTAEWLIRKKYSLP